MHDRSIRMSDINKWRREIQQWDYGFHYANIVLPITDFPNGALAVFHFHYNILTHFAYKVSRTGGIIYWVPLKDDFMSFCRDLIPEYFITQNLPVDYSLDEISYAREIMDQMD